MPRRIRVRTLSDEELDREHVDAIVRLLLGDADEDPTLATHAERVEREWRKRHRARVDGCTCRVCCATWFDALEA